MKIERSIESHERARALLRILKAQGPLASSTMQKIIEPPITMRRLHDSLARLIRKNLVIRRHPTFHIKSYESISEVASMIANCLSRD